jgi:iron uptake system EfeUOB component EfeO/EfeM
MKKRYSILAPIMLTGLLAAGCGADDENEEPIKDDQPKSAEEQSRDVPLKVDDVVATVVELRSYAESADNSGQIQETGKSLEDNWDLVEGEIEEQYPDDYKNIEESLYPLIAEAKKDKPDPEKIKTLSDETNKKLTDFLEKAETPKKTEE